jgi:hypothetical protein
MNQMDAAVLEGFARSFAPIDIFAPLDSWWLDRVVPAKIGNGLPKDAGSLLMEEFHQPTIHLPAANYGWNEHAHEM